MDEKLEEYKQLIIQFNPEIKTIEVKDDWTDTVESRTIMASYNGCQMTEDYRYALGNYERIFYDALDADSIDSLGVAKRIRKTCLHIQTYLYAHRNEHYGYYSHSKMPKDFYNSFGDSVNHVDSFLKIAFESVERVLEFANDLIESNIRLPLSTLKEVSSTVSSESGVPKPSRVERLTAIFKNLIHNGISVCDPSECKNLAQYLLDNEYRDGITLQIKIDNRRFKLIYDQIQKKFGNITNQNKIEENRFLLKNESLQPWKSSNFSSARFDESSKNPEKATKPKDYDVIIGIFNADGQNP